MALSQYSFATQTLAVGTNTELGGAITLPGHYTLLVDLSAMASGDTLVFTFLVQCVLSGTFRTVASQTYTGAQSPVNAAYPFVAMMVPFQGEVFVEQTAGTGRSITWTLQRVDD